MPGTRSRPGRTAPTQKESQKEDKPDSVDSNFLLRSKILDEGLRKREQEVRKKNKREKKYKEDKKGEQEVKKSNKGEKDKDNKKKDTQAEDDLFQPDPPPRTRGRTTIPGTSLKIHTLQLSLYSPTR